MTLYADLYGALCRYVDRDPTQDLQFAETIPYFFQNAQLRIARECNLAGLHNEVPGDFTPGSALIRRPVEGTQTINYVEAWEGTKPKTLLRSRPINFVKQWREFQTGFALPRYYALYDRDQLFVVPIPGEDMHWRIGFRFILDFLGPSVQTSYLSEVHPDLLLDALIVEAVQFGKEDKAENAAELAKWEASYQRRKASAIANEIYTGLGATEAGVQVRQA